MFAKFWNQSAWYTLAISVGKYMIDVAKMIGITPAWLTFSGRYVLVPPIMRRPTTRLAYWIGIRRWPWSMKTTATMMPRPISITTTNLPAPP